MYFEFSGRGGAWRRSCCAWQGEAGVKGFIVFACAVVVVCAVAVWFVATHRAKCIKYAARDEFLYMMPVATEPPSSVVGVINKLSRMLG